MTSRRLLGFAVAVLLAVQGAAALVHEPPPERTPPSPQASATAVATIPPPQLEVDPSAPAPEHPLVGAHYHLWYPSNFDQGFLRPRLVPPQQPALGRYRSDDPAVAEQHIAWASSSGIDFFTIDWWPARPEQNANVSGLLEAENIGDIRFCIFYETWDLGFVAERESTPMNPATIERFVADMDDLAERFFDHPSYLRIGDRPVVILYLSRTMTGDVAGAIDQARRSLAERGVDVFFIGDEVFWRPLQPERMRLFDAITAYNLYEHEKRDHRGFPAETSLVADQVELYRQHAAAVDGSVPVVPAVFPGYNDRGVRPSLDHYAVPRRWGPGDPEGSLLRQMIALVARPLLDPRAPMLFVTSWNEWNEDTAIEPLAPAPETGRDDSESGTLFTEGYAYGGGDSQLRALRDEVVAVAGRVVDDGAPVPGVRVEARRPDGELLAADVTDSRGAFTLSRWLLSEGVVVLVAGDGVARVTVEPERTVLVDLPA